MGGACVSQNARDRATALAVLIACRSGDADALGGLLEFEAVDLNRASEAGLTPLMHACAGGHADVARMLIDAGADIDGRDAFGWTALHHAAANDRSAVVGVLLSNRCDTGLRTRRRRGSAGAAVPSRATAFDTARWTRRYGVARQIRGFGPDQGQRPPPRVPVATVAVLDEDVGTRAKPY